MEEEVSVGLDRQSVDTRLHVADRAPRSIRSAPRLPGVVRVPAPQGNQEHPRKRHGLTANNILNSNLASNKMPFSSPWLGSRRTRDSERGIGSQARNQLVRVNVKLSCATGETTRGQQGERGQERDGRGVGWSRHGHSTEYQGPRSVVILYSDRVNLASGPQLETQHIARRAVTTLVRNHASSLSTASPASRARAARSSCRYPR